MKNFWKSGDPYVWITGGALMTSLLMVGGLLLLIGAKGLGFFWPADIAQMRLKDGTVLLGRITGKEKIPSIVGDSEDRTRVHLKIGNRDLYGLDFKWVDEDRIEKIEFPLGAVVLERREWGDMYAFIEDIERDGVSLPGEEEGLWEALGGLIREARGVYSRIREIETEEIGRINYRIERKELKIKALKLKGKGGEEWGEGRVARLEAEIEGESALYLEKEKELEALYRKLNENDVVMKTADGRSKTVPVGRIVRAYRPNAMGVLLKLGLYGSKLKEFLLDSPRESNTEGGVFPAIFGTVFMVLIMSVAVMPFGVLAAVYLAEYARPGPFVQIVRICINNLAGVPSIVFGIFGVGFFIYGIGGTIDSFFYPEALPTPTYGTGGILWASLTLALLTLPVVIVATEEGLSAVPTAVKHGSYALGATKSETLRRVMIPTAMPGILTGLILAIARATGEVAPLMITGVVKLAPTLPIDANFPYVHLDRKFMHLGFHIYDVGFQSPNVEAAKSIVYATTLLLIAIVLVLTIFAVVIRNRLRKKYSFGEL
ncbi:MAG: phosphate ABC transporter permease PstA [Thermodesulfobacteriota bacterium]